MSLCVFAQANVPYSFVLCFLELSNKQVYKQMAELASESAETEYALVEFYQRPFEIMAKADIAKNALRLHPITDLNKIVATDKGAGIVAESKNFTFKVEPPPQVPHG